MIALFFYPQRKRCSIVAYKLYSRELFILNRYNSLSESHRQTFGFEEDNLLSIILHNLLVYMLVVGLTPQDTTGIVHRFSARTRLAIVEERMMQQTLKHIEQCIEEDVRNNNKKGENTYLVLLNI